MFNTSLKFPTNRATSFSYCLVFSAFVLPFLTHAEQAYEPHAYRSVYRAEHMCWLHHYSLYFGFLVVMAAVIIHNIFVIIFVMRETTINRKKVTPSYDVPSSRVFSTKARLPSAVKHSIYFNF